MQTWRFAPSAGIIFDQPLPCQHVHEMTCAMQVSQYLSLSLALFGVSFLLLLALLRALSLFLFLLLELLLLSLLQLLPQENAAIIANVRASASQLSFHRRPEKTHSE